MLSTSCPVCTLLLPFSPGSNGHACLTWVFLTIHQFPNELLIDSAHFGTAATCSHCEVVKPCILEEGKKQADAKEAGRVEARAGLVGGDVAQ